MDLYVAFLITATVLLVILLLSILMRGTARFLSHAKDVQRSREEMRRWTEELERRVAERTEELKATDKKLMETWEQLMKTEKLALLGNVAAGVAHEVRNPLNAIGLTVSHLQDAFSPEDKELRERFQKLTSNIQREVKRLEKTVKRFLEFSKPSEPEMELKDLRRVLDEALLLTEEASTDNVKIVRDYKKNRVEAMVDGGRLREAFLNIIINAIQAMPQGGSLTISAKNRSKETVEVSFQDTGPGIPPKDIDKLFDPYFSSKKKGIGLGLAIVRRIVDEHRGEIGVESKEGAGTTFTITLPVKGKG